MRIGVYSRFWNTAGGGEVYAGTLAEILSRNHDVELVSESDIDVDRLRDRLRLELGSLPHRVVGDVDDAAFGRGTADLDLFVNCSHGSQRPNWARHGIYIVHFPDLGGTGRDAPRLAKAMGKRLGHGARLEWGFGVHAEESEGGRSWRWTAGSGTIHIHAPPGRRLLLDLTLSMMARPGGSEAEAVVSVDGERHASLPPGPLRHEITIPVVGRDAPIPVRIDIEAFSPRALVGVDDPRLLGLQVERATVRATGVRGMVGRTLPPGALDPEPHDFLSSYDAVISNSDFTARWVKKRWRMSSVVLEPPVRSRIVGQKRPVILSVGRFFGPESGHSKRQLEMIGAFRELYQSAPGWELHLVGGCSEFDLPYLRRVEAEVRDLPVQLHVNASGAEVDQLYAQAAIYWHATGLGEDPTAHPERMEHFGISVVEAMSAGAVPVVLATGGPAYVVRPGWHGLHFRDASELINASLRLIGDEGLRHAMACRSVERATAFGPSEFETRVNALVADIVA